ncbi:MAG TPA: hypothetical protein VF974_04935 [Patescibacteria group bacterium]
MKDKIVDMVQFFCKVCPSNDLRSPGAVKTLADRMYLAFTCDKCKGSVTIEVNSIVAELYSTPLGPESSRVN